MKKQANKNQMPIERPSEKEIQQGIGKILKKQLNERVISINSMKNAVLNLK